MTITASRTVHVNLGNFEWVEITRTITDIPADADPEEVSLMLDKLMLDDIIRAREATTYPDEGAKSSTSVYYWEAIGKEARG